MEKSVKLKVVLYGSKKLKNGENPIMFRITKDRKSKYIATGYSAKPEQWDIKNNKPKSKHPKATEIETYLNIEGKKISKGFTELILDEKPYSAEHAASKVK